ncbi:hypothetical protein, partial [Bowmanella yangjiangensis]
SMKITQEVRDYAAAQEQATIKLTGLNGEQESVQLGMQQMSEAFKQSGSELYHPAKSKASV